MTLEKAITSTSSLEKKIAYIHVCLHKVQVAKKVLCELYPDAAAHSKPQASGIILRRFSEREHDLLQFLQMYEEELKGRETK